MIYIYIFFIYIEKACVYSVIYIYIDMFESSSTDNIELYKLQNKTQPQENPITKKKQKASTTPTKKKTREMHVVFFKE